MDLFINLLRAFGVAGFVLATVAIAFGGPPRWVNAPDADCTVHNWYGGKEWHWAETTAMWTGPCVGGHADGSGVLEWRRDGTVTLHYEGEMSAGEMTGHGVMTTPQGTRYDGDWEDGWLQRGVVVYRDGKRYEGDLYRGAWSKGVLTAPGGYRMEGTWYEGRLDGKGVAEGPEGRYEGDWYKGLPDGSGVLATAGGARYQGEWKKGCFQSADRKAAADASAKDCGFDGPSVH
jgi:hypothetical protein